MKLQTKISLLITLIIIAISGFSLLVTDKIMKKAFDAELTEKGQILIETLAELSSKPVIDNNVLETSGILGKIVSRTDHVEYAYVIGFDGQVFAHTFPKGFPKTLAEAQHHDRKYFPVINKYLFKEKPIFDMAYPLIKGLKAHIHIGMDESRQQMNYLLLRRQIFLFSGVFILLGIMASVLISRRLIEPMKKLGSYINGFGQGTVQGAIEINGSATEVAQLSKLFNKMVFRRQEAEEAIKKAALEWRTAMDASEDVLYLLDLDRHILRANKAFYNVTGSTAQEVIGEHIEKIVHPQGESIPCSVCLAQMELRDKIVIMESDHPDNPTQSPLEITVKIVKDEKEKPVSIFMRLRDLTEQRKVETFLRRSKEEWENTFDALSDIITIQDKDMRILKANRIAHEIFQVKPGELTGRYCYEVFRQANQPCPNCPEVHTIQDQATHSAIITHKNLDKIFQVTSSPILDAKGDFKNLVHIARDITEQKKMEEELFQAHKMEAVGTLAGGIAHDFNNILAAILGYADMAHDETTEGSLAGKYLDEVLKAGNRAKELVRQILTFSRKETEILEPLLPVPIIKEGLKLLRASLPTTIEIHEEIAPDCGMINGNPTNIHQILVNLCTNAFHAMIEESGLLTVKLTRVELEEQDVLHETGISSGFFVELLVSDTGCGMDQKTLKHIFEPYFTTKEPGKGTGMGLAVTYNIIQACGGFVKVESEPGAGSTFHVYFPAITEEPSISGEIHKQQSFPRGDERILVVDDEKEIVGMYKASLEGLGYRVTAHCSSEKALEEFRLRPDSFDLIITDQTMPNLPGAKLAQKILQIRTDFPIILCTGYSSMITKEKAWQIGIKRFIMKPVGRKELAVAVREELDRTDVSDI